MNMSERDIDQQIAGTEEQITVVEKHIATYKLAKCILKLVLRDLNNRKVICEAEKIINTLNIDKS